MRSRINAEGLPTRPEFFYFSPVMVDDSPEALIPPGAPIAALPFGQPSYGPPPPPGFPPGGFWSQYGNFPVPVNKERISSPKNYHNVNFDLFVGSAADAPDAPPNPPAVAVAIGVLHTLLSL
jgi:hypothetical protein